MTVLLEVYSMILHVVQYNVCVDRDGRLYTQALSFQRCCPVNKFRSAIDIMEAPVFTSSIAMCGDRCVMWKQCLFVITLKIN